jgi:DNA replication protein DnaC
VLSTPNSGTERHNVGRGQLPGFAEQPLGTSGEVEKRGADSSIGTGSQLPALSTELRQPFRRRRERRRREHEPQRVVIDLLTAEISEKQARSIKYQIAIARLPMAKEIDEFVFDGTPINETLVRDLAGGAFLAQQRNLVLIGGTGTGKTHLAVGIPRACIRGGARGRFFNAVDLVNKLEAEARTGRQGRIADHLCRMDLVVLDELGYSPSPRPAASSSSISSAGSTSRPRSSYHQPRLR